MTDQLPLGFVAPEAPRSSALRHYHVRSHQPVDEALAGEARASRQDSAVLDYFRMQTAAVPGFRATPSQVWRALEGLGWPLTSARRSLTTITRAGLLAHHPEDRRPGMYGAQESTWGLA